MKQTGNTRGKTPSASPGPRVPAPNRENAGAINRVPTAPSSWWAALRLQDRILLPLRLFLGITFIYAGIQKLTDPQYFNRSAPGYIGKQIIAFANRSPIHNFLITVAVPHATFFGALVALGEIAIGIGALVGFLLRPASFFGMLLSLMFFLSASWNIYPYFYGADIVFVFAWITLLLAGPLRSGLPTLDAILVPRSLQTLSPESQATVGRILSILLGVGNEGITGISTQQLPAQGMNQQDVPGGYPPQVGTYNSNVRGYPQGVPHQVMNNQGNRYAPAMTQQQRQMSYKAQMAAQRRAMDSRRNFLWGLVAGGLGMLGLTFVGKALQINPFGGDNTSTSQFPETGGNTGSQSTPATGSGTSTGASGAPTVIAKESAVPVNSAVTFTIPSNGDPGVLIHLNNGKFVCFDATCTHAGCPVSFDPSSSDLICPCHGAQFDPANGAAVLSGPTSTPLTSVPITIDNSTGNITLQ